MDVVSTAIVVAGEAAAEPGPTTNPYAYGLTAFGILVIGLIVAWMIKVGR